MKQVSKGILTADTAAFSYHSKLNREMKYQVYSQILPLIVTVCPDVHEQWIVHFVSKNKVIHKLFQNARQL